MTYEQISYSARAVRSIVLFRKRRTKLLCQINGTVGEINKYGNSLL